MDREPPVKLGDLVTFVHSPQPGEYGIVIKLEDDFAEVLWSSWGTIECSYASFTGDHWGNLKVITHGN
jgi:hypothetical protein